MVPLGERALLRDVGRRFGEIMRLLLLMTCSRTRFIVIRKVARSWLKGDLVHSLTGRGKEIGRLRVGDVWHSAETWLSLV